MPQKSPKITINLSTKGKPKVSDVVYKWMIDAGRGIIVLIELVALGALAYRFVIDKQIVDLRDEIKQQETYVQRQTKNEELYRGIQSRLANIKQTTEDTASKVAIMNVILKDIKTGIFSSANLVVNRNSIGLTGDTFTIFTLNSFIETIKLYPDILSINIDEINTGDQGLKFKLTIRLKEIPIPTAKKSS